jgi:capsular exopolysaccharide synthesis family protein
MEKFEKALQRARKETAGQVGTVGDGTGIPSAPSAAVNPQDAATRIAFSETPVEPRLLGEQAHNLIALDYTNPSADLFRVLRTQVLKVIKGLASPTVGICSAQTGEGKTFVAANLASSIALSQEWSALLLDLDLRRPALHRHFRMASNPGITEFLVGNVPLTNCVRSTQVPGLELLAAGTPIHNSSEALGSSRLESAFFALSRAMSNRVLVCDLPPLLVSDDALLFSAKLGGVILVVEEGRTKSRDVQRAVELLATTKIIGTVLNKSKTKSPRYSESYAKPARTHGMIGGST